MIEDRIIEHDPPDPPFAKQESLISPKYMPPWVMPMTFYIMQGCGSRECVNGISLDEDNDLLLYRKISAEDRVMWPSLVGVDEVWIQARIPAGNAV